MTDFHTPDAPDGNPATENDVAPMPAATRRQMFRIGLGAAPAAALAAVATPARAADPEPSPRITPFLEPLRIPPELPQRPLSDPAFARRPTVAPNRAINPATGLPFEGRGDAHQKRHLNPPQFFYAQRYGQVPPVSIHPQLRPQLNFWGANLGGSDLQADPPTSPLPTIVSRYQAGANTAILVRRYNDLPKGVPAGGFGRNSISTHLHNFHSAPDSDGGPCDPRLGGLAEDPYTQGRFFFPGQYYDYYYNMKRAGFTRPGMPDGDVRETLGTLWYHDHREAHTAENVYKGLYGFHLIFNEHDTGDETTGFRLPSYPAYDVPLCFCDLRLDPRTEQTVFDLEDDDGHIGDRYMVNGRLQPYMDVMQRRYRFRLLNVGPSRFHQLYLVNPDQPSQRIPFWLIANDGNLLPKPLQVPFLRLSCAERADVIVDFRELTAPGGPAAGATRLWLENRLLQDKGRGPEDELLPPGNPDHALIEFRIGAVATDLSVHPAQIANFAPITLPPLGTPVITRTFDWGRGNGGWVVNDKPINCDEVRFTMKKGTVERWIHKTGGGWAHPIHNHFVEGRIVRRNGKAIGPNSPEFSRKDVIWLGEGDEVEYIVRAQDYDGVYPLHCHNVVHEDKGMMLLFAVDDVGDNKTRP